MARAIMKLLSAVQFSHQLAAECVQPGDFVIDATMGNGSDTLFLAQLAGPSGTVYSFDIQEQALIRTKARLDEHLDSSYTRIHLLRQCHAQMLRAVPAESLGGVSAIMFNLGYLPGGDHRVVTHTETTINAIRVSILLLKPGGIITIVLYTGHAGGSEEAEAIIHEAKQLPQDQYQVLTYQFLNQQHHPPFLLAIQKIHFRSK